MLLAVAIVGGIAHHLTKTKSGKEHSLIAELQRRYIYAAIIFGALLPDLSLFVMFGYAKLTNVPHSVIWSEMYYAQFWQWLGAISNSIPVYLSLALLSTLGLRTQGKGILLKNPKVTLPRVKPNRLAYVVLTASLAALAHCVTDLPLHHDDGHPHFWPFSTWIYASPVSYWDVRHHANFWVPIECIAGLTLVFILWKRNFSRWAKGFLALAGVSYIVFAGFFFT